MERRILLIGTRSPGGISTYISTLAESLREAGEVVQVSASHGKGGQRVSTLGQILTFLCVLLDLTKFCLAKGRPIVHAHVSMRGSVYRKIVVLLVCRAFRSQYVLHIHGSEFEAAYKESSGFYRILVNALLRFSDHVIVLSEELKRFAEVEAKVSSSRVTYIRNFVKDIGLRSRQVTESDPRVLFLGAIGQRKGIFDLIKAIPFVVERFPGVKLVVGGAGDMAAFYLGVKEVGIESNVEYLGWIDDEGKRREFQKASLLILPSYHEGLPLVLLEAMSAGVPVVATAVGGIPQLITNNNNGKLVSAGNVTQISTAILDIISDGSSSERMSRLGRQTFENLYSSSVVIPKVIKIYDMLER